MSARWQVYFLIVGLWQWDGGHVQTAPGPLAALSGLWVLALLAVGSLAIPLRVWPGSTPEATGLLADIQAHRDPLGPGAAGHAQPAAHG